MRQIGRARVAHGLQALIGRPATVRLARGLLDEARLDVRNTIATNGERHVQRSVLRHADPREPVVVLDVGAHHGEWSGHLIRQAREQGRRLDLHAFEPTASSFAELERRLDGSRAFATLNRSGLSDAAGAALVHSPHEGAGSTSLYDGDWGRGRPTASERVILTTIDAYCEDHGIARIDLLKCDAEGHDLHVLEGARRALSGRRVSVVQFEYNAAWIEARRYLRDAFTLLAPWGYRLGKVTPRGIERYPRWDAELETFREGNYLAVAAGAHAWFTWFDWWR